MNKPNQQSTSISEEEMQAYLQGKLKPEEAAALEAKLQAEEMNMDAMEGLMEMGLPRNQQSVQKVNQRVSARLSQKRITTRRKRIRHQGVFWQVILGILLLLALAWIFFYLLPIHL